MWTVVEAITLQTGSADFTEALTDNYLKIQIAGRTEANRWIQSHVEAIDGEMLVGWPATTSGIVEKAGSNLPSSTRDIIVTGSAPNLTNALT